MHSRLVRISFLFILLPLFTIGSEEGKGNCDGQTKQTSPSNSVQVPVSERASQKHGESNTFTDTLGCWYSVVTIVQNKKQNTLQPYQQPYGSEFP